MLSSHDMAQVEEICDSVTILHRGTVAHAGRLDVMRADAPDPVWRLRTSDDTAAVAAVVRAAGEGGDPRRRRPGRARGAGPAR